jgi:hypothetical protein
MHYLRAESLRRLKVLLAGIIIWSFLFLTITGSAFLFEVSAQAGAIGYPGHSFLASGEDNTTGEKAESKLWWNDCSWWASMFNQDTRAYHIYRLNSDLQVWEDTGTLIDDRNASRSDILWDEAAQKLYIVSHPEISSPRPARPGEEGLLYRFSYDSRIDRYSLDAGYPVQMMNVVPRVLTIAKDANGWLWITYVSDDTIQVQYSEDDGRVWSEPFTLPLDGTRVLSQDIAAVIAFEDKIGIGWTNQRVGAIYFAVHRVGEPTDAWTGETVIDGGRVADNHLNMAVDGEGRVYLATKTSNNRGSQPFILIHVRDTDQSWTTHVFGLQHDDHTRPIILIDDENEQLYVFATAPQTGGSIYYKSTPLDAIAFDDGRGTPILSFSDATINNVTSTKQRLNAGTGLVILASARDSRRYYHNFISLAPEDSVGVSGGGTCVAETPTTSPGVVYYVSSPITINVRTAPATSAGVLARLVPGTQVIYLGEVEGDFVDGDNRWARVEIDGQIAYIHNTLLSEAP